MSLYKRGDIYWMSFGVNGKSVRRSTGQKSLKLAQEVEREMQSSALRNKLSAKALRIAGSVAPSEWREKVAHEFAKAGGGEIGVLCRRAKRRSGETGKEFLLDPDLLSLAMVQCNGVCSVTGMPISFYGESHSKPSIDRIDCARGYTMDNIRITSVIANMAMNQWGEQALRLMCGHFAMKLFSQPPA